MSVLAAIVLAGGGSRRLGGADKPSVSIGGCTLLERACAAVRAVGIGHIVVVGPQRGRETGVMYTQESPPGSGPAAAVAAGVRTLRYSDAADMVLVLACDMPGVASALPALMTAATRAVANGHHGAMARVDGHDQFLLFAASTAALAQALDSLELRNCSMRQVIESLNLTRIDVSAPEAVDVDTWQGVVTVRQQIAGGDLVTPVNEWIGEANRLAEVEAAVDIDAILDLARDAAHGVARPAAPISTFILGYAAAARGLDAAEVAALAATLGRAAAAHADGQESLE